MRAALTQATAPDFVRRMLVIDDLSVWLGPVVQILRLQDSKRMNSQIRHVLIASAPAAVAGCWNLGRQASIAGVDASSAWQLTLLSNAGMYHEDMGVLTTLLAGAALFAPVLIVSLLVSRVWAEVFARVRRRALDHGWLLTAWLFALLLPVSMPLWAAALGLSFAVVFGSHVFGGSGRYLVNPALLGVVVLTLAFPPYMEVWLPGDSAASTWAVISTAGLAASLEQGFAVGPLFLGSELGAVGVTSALLCLVGVVYLIGARLASALVIGGAIAGLALGAVLIGDLPSHWHLALGNFAFLLAFIATDTATRPRTTGGAIAYGALFGFVTIAIRMANPEHPEGSTFALLIAMLAVPLLDYPGAALRAGRSQPTEGGGA